MTIKFGFVIQFAARWLSGFGQQSTIAQPATPTMLIEAAAEARQVRPVVILDRLPHPRRRLIQRGTFGGSGSRSEASSARERDDRPFLDMASGRTGTPLKVASASAMPPAACASTIPHPSQRNRSGLSPEMQLELLEAMRER
jgi:hypothetical protein